MDQSTEAKELANYLRAVINLTEEVRKHRDRSEKIKAIFYVIEVICKDELKLNEDYPGVKSVLQEINLPDETISQVKVIERLVNLATKWELFK